MAGLPCFGGQAGRPLVPTHTASCSAAPGLHVLPPGQLKVEAVVAGSARRPAIGCHNLAYAGLAEALLLLQPLNILHKRHAVHLVDGWVEHRALRGALAGGSHGCTCCLALGLSLVASGGERRRARVGVSSPAWPCGATGGLGWRWDRSLLDAAPVATPAGQGARVGCGCSSETRPTAEGALPSEKGVETSRCKRATPGSKYVVHGVRRPCTSRNTHSLPQL
jgi:hypothetical protein